MKQLVCLVAAIGLFVSSFSQTPSLSITTNKTTSLIFPFTIKHVDRGTREILVQQVKEADNILLIKAAGKDFPETNLTVITSDGSTYNFSVDYENKPLLFVYNLPVQSSASLATYANSILDNPKTINGISTRKWDMLVRVYGIYIKGNTIFYQLELDNQSPIDYDIDFLRFYIRDKKKSKRTAIQENELKPLYVAGNNKQVKAYQKNTLVFALEKFTIPDAKYLAIQIMEKNGGRHLFMKVNNRKIMQAIPLPDLK
ncbi:MAG TPA: conjugative transposon protein TraN [Hanamia sp.]|nr:conjugative transposon protein TraN [Hanamia sp.]